jgi:hypothetical protein
MYADDSFNTLTTIQQIGLTTVSVLLCVVCIFFCYQLIKNKSLLIRLLISIGVFFLFVWLSPQVYYTYYLMIFDDLPFQIVIKQPPSPWALIQLLTFQSKVSLSDHSKAILGWVLIIMALVKGKY